MMNKLSISRFCHYIVFIELNFVHIQPLLALLTLLRFEIL